MFLIIFHVAQFSNKYVLIFFPISFRGHLKVKELDMMHALDYSNMGMDQMQRKMQQNKAKDLQFAHKFQ